MDIQEIDRITTKYGGFLLSECLINLESDYAIYHFNYENSYFEHSDGINDDIVFDLCTKNFQFEGTTISAGYKQITEKFERPIELFIFNSNLFNQNDSDLYELIVFHEVCHLLEKTEYYKELVHKFSEEEIEIGGKLNAIANKIDHQTGGWGVDEDHNQAFGSLLYKFLKLYDDENCHKLLGKAMIKNFLEDYSNEFKII